ncbi:MAG TPA: hypothetical protein VGX76_06115 [Pirellulales bacterium]|jgi:hypothetical protein|nr:hypothetical protein [Pirellulales bacterium]
MDQLVNNAKPTSADIKALLSSAGKDLTEDQAAALTAFVECLGIERARRAIESLEQLKQAA